MSTRKERGRPAHPDILTPAEWRVAEGVRHGLSNPQIAARHGIGVDAVKFHVSNILGKLGMDSRAELRRWNGVERGSAMKETKTMTDNNPVGRIGQIARTVSDIDAARAWYRDVFGLKPLFDAGNMAFFDCDGTRVMLVEGDAGPESILYFSVTDLHAACAGMEERGAKIISAPHRIHTHDDGREEWMGFVEDNDGRPLGLMATVSSAPSSSQET